MPLSGNANNFHKPSCLSPPVITHNRHMHFSGFLFLLLSSATGRNMLGLTLKWARTILIISRYFCSRHKGKYLC